MKTNAYLQKVRTEMAAYRNANGSSGNFKNAGGNGTLLNGPGSMGRKPGNWNANGGSSMAMPSTEPIIISITNASNAVVMNFDIFGAGEYLFGNFKGGSWDSNGNFTINGVTISAVFAGSISYQQILSSTLNNPWTAGGVYLQSTSGSPSQVTDTYKLTSNGTDGQLYTRPIKPFLDPYQFQSGVTYNQTSFNMGGLTKLTWNKIYASASFEISIFPAQEVNPGAALNGQNVVNNYTKPKVIGNLR